MSRSIGILLIALLIQSSAALTHESGTTANAAAESRESAGLVVEEFGETAPWTHLEFNNATDNFQFLIVSDRTGGNRAGVFPDALRKAELLQPEFIMSVGDLIQGYTEDRAEVNRQWDEFGGLLSDLSIPFFHVAGNHDFSNSVMGEIWQERHGRPYYHFRYRDVLFLCANTEDGRRATIGEEQIAYFRDVLARHSDVRWTLVFQHRPLWVGDAERAPGWIEFENLLQDRDYTVFAGHFHRYTKHVRNDRRYIILATTGGGSDLGGPDRGEFDHVAWVTMTDEGPVLANLMLDGIWDEDIFTTRTAELLTQLVNVRPSPHLLSSSGEVVTEMGFRVINDEDIPLQVTAIAEPHALLPVAWTMSAMVPPNSVEDFEVPLQPAPAGIGVDGSPVPVTVTTGYAPADHRPLEITRTLNLAAARLRTLPAKPAGLRIDGQLTDWPELGYRTTPEDGSSSPGMEGNATFALGRDAEMLYVAVRVVDDVVIADDPASGTWERDYVEVRLDPRPFARRAPYIGQWDNRTAIYLAGFPSQKAGAAEVWRRDRFPAELRVEQRLTADGYALELAVPLSWLEERSGVGRLDGLSVNVTAVDLDMIDGDKRHSSWQAAWHVDEAVVGAGSFELR
ncbi:MAG: hypothetical protein GY835_00750 [bacterium]|nr:hypothetical protein [bacterium]